MTLGMRNGLIFLMGFVVTSCNGERKLELNGVEVRVPNGWHTIRSDSGAGDAFDSDRSIRIVYSGDMANGEAPPFKAFDPTQGPALEFISGEDYVVEKIDDLDRDRFFESSPNLNDLRYFVSRDRYPIRKYYDTNGRMALICFIEGNSIICKRTLDLKRVVIEYRFDFLDSSRISEMDRFAANLVGHLDNLSRDH